LLPAPGLVGSLQPRVPVHAIFNRCGMPRMNPEHFPTVAIVGAGLSGMACARVLQDAGVNVRLFDKSRSPGGRLATRRTDHGSFDHGAQYFTARDPRFQPIVQHWQERGIVASWTPALVAIELVNGVPVRSPVGDGTVRHVGVPSMNRIATAMAEGLAVHADCTVDSARRSADAGHRWMLTGTDHRGEPVAIDDTFDWLVAAMPSPQAARLLADVETMQAQATALPMVPCWAVLASFSAPLATDFDAAFVNASALTWIARNNAKPGRDPRPECWVLHAARDWSEHALEATPEAVCARMLAEFRRVTGCDDQPLTARAHRWRYSGPGARSGEPCLFDADSRTGACGDWLAGSRVEGAFLSGLSLGERILAAVR
jgi:predicted NAD/FAD-dependent oxidoreductase